MNMLPCHQSNFYRKAQFFLPDDSVKAPWSNSMPRCPNDAKLSSSPSPLLESQAGATSMCLILLVAMISLGCRMPDVLMSSPVSWHAQSISMGDTLCRHVGSSSTTASTGVVGDSHAHASQPPPQPTCSTRPGTAAHKQQCALVHQGCLSPCSTITHHNGEHSTFQSAHNLLH